MFDRQLLVLSKPLVERVAKTLHQRRYTANQISISGFALGLVAAFAVATGHPTLALAPLLLNRLFDGLDGAVARLSGPSDQGAFLDITLDFLFYGAIPLAFGIYNPTANALPSAVLLSCFLGTGTSFLAYAIMAEKRGMKSTTYPGKGFYYLGGLTEGFETVLCFALMCVFPQHFPLLAFVYAAMCCLTTATRLIAGWKTFGAAKP